MHRPLHHSRYLVPADPLQLPHRAVCEVWTGRGPQPDTAEEEQLHQDFQCTGKGSQTARPPLSSDLNFYLLLLYSFVKHVGSLGSKLTLNDEKFIFPFK